jgi:hypothetical protein
MGSVLAVAVLAACGERSRAPSSSAAPPASSVAAAPSAQAAAARDAPPAASAGSSSSAAGLAEPARALPIPARAQAPESPPSGWCGETAIQEGLLHLGVWAPQRLINKAGRPVHPDLYATEIPAALSAMGVRFSIYSARRGFEPFAMWARAAVDEGDPVLAGVKILPTEHPEWGLDHFVLVVGHGANGLLVNTTWGTRQWVGDTTTPGLSLKNAFYGLRLTGVELPKNALRARLALVDETGDVVKLRVSCAGLTTGARYRMERRSARSEPKALWSEEATAVGAQVSSDVTAPADSTSRFHCVAL